MASFLLLLMALLGSVAVFAQETPNVIHAIIPRGNRRIPAETIKSRVFTHAGDPYDPAALERDFNSLWNTGYFEDLRIERSPTPQGWDVIVYVKEKPTIREIDYVGLTSVSRSDVLDRFKERKVSVSQESQYDPTKVKRAEVVLKELLAEHGRQFATVKTEVHPIPPAAVGLTFVVNEGPKVKVGKIAFEGNQHVKSRTLRSAMKNLKPIGVPHSIFLENLWSKTYDAGKLNEDAERVRDAYQQRGYFKALVGDPKTKMRATSSIFDVRFSKTGVTQARGGKAVDVTMPVEEGERYYLAGINFSGNKAISDTTYLRRIFPMKDGDLFDTSQVRKGLEALRKAYGGLGYINFTPVPDTKLDDEHHKITLNIDLDEGKQFFVRRIEFQGNSTTRDKVIRRELAVEEGQVFNSRMWELSLLRLNQLQYFEPLKTEGQAAPGERSDEIKTNNQDATVDITLKVKEKGKNSVGLTGGVSGLAGSFIGVNYTTNNFLGMGETLSVGFNIGALQRDLEVGFTEPYAFDRPLQLGFTFYDRKYDFNQAQLSNILGTQSSQTFSQSVLQSLQNFSQSSKGITLSASYPLHRSFKRIGIAYTLDDSTLTTFTDASRDFFEFLNFRSISGLGALNGIITSKVTPSFSINKIDNPARPHNGYEFIASADIAGLGGSIREIRPTVQYRRFVPMKGLKPTSSAEGRNTLGFRLLGSYLRGYGGRVATPFDRFYTGGDNDLRGFDIRAVTPYALITSGVDFPLTSPTPGSTPLNNSSNQLSGNATVHIPVQQIVFTGGDTEMVANLEYRIPIVGPVTLAPFMDFGLNFDAGNSQLQLNSAQVSSLNTTPYGCPIYSSGTGCSGAAKISTPFAGHLSTMRGTNFVPRMSTGLELQVIMPVINAPFRIYYALNAMRLNTTAPPAAPFTRSMFPANTSLGDYNYHQALALYAPTYQLKEPASTFRFTVSTTF